MTLYVVEVCKNSEICFDTSNFASSLIFSSWSSIVSEICRKIIRNFANPWYALYNLSNQAGAIK